MNNTLKSAIESPLKTEIREQNETIEALKIMIAIHKRYLKNAVSHMETLNDVYCSETKAKRELQAFISECKRILGSK